jgi:hypothetical protein
MEIHDKTTEGALGMLQTKIDDIKERITDQDYIDLCSLTKELSNQMPCPHLIGMLKARCLETDEFDLDSTIFTLMHAYERAEKYSRIVCQLVAENYGITMPEQMGEVS